MRNEVLMRLKKNQDYFVFLRENPHYYRMLNRYPYLINDFFEDYKLKRRKRLVDKVDDLSLMIRLAKELI